MHDFSKELARLEEINHGAEMSGMSGRYCGLAGALGALRSGDLSLLSRTRAFCSSTMRGPEPEILAIIDSVLERVEGYDDAAREEDSPKTEQQKLNELRRTIIGFCRESGFSDSLVKSLYKIKKPDVLQRTLERLEELSLVLHVAREAGLISSDIHEEIYSKSKNVMSLTVRVRNRIHDHDDCDAKRTFKKLMDRARGAW